MQTRKYHICTTTVTNTTQQGAVRNLEKRKEINFVMWDRLELTVTRVILYHFSNVHTCSMYAWKDIFTS